VYLHILTNAGLNVAPADVDVVARVWLWFLACVKVTWCVWVGEGGNVCGYALIIMSKMWLCVSVRVPFNCTAFSARLYFESFERVQFMSFFPSM
jgi:hypothetical protein